MSTLFVEPLIANASTARPIRRSLPVWLTLLGAWTGGMALTASLVDIDVGATFVAGLLALVAVGGLARARPELLGFSLLLAAALLYGAYYAGITRTLRAEREVPLVEAAEQIAASIEGPSPVVCGAATSFRDCFIISRRLRRPLQRRPPETGAYFLVDGIQTRPRATALVEASPLALWRVGD